jgi:ribose 5-phosphate isomerase A
MDVEALKRAAAARAVEFVQPGMKVGLGTGTTAHYFTQLLGERVRAGLQIVGVPSSDRTRQEAEKYGVPLTTFDQAPLLDMTVDGADEVAPDLSLIKGGGGALLHEKIVATASKRMVVIADESKWVAALGRHPLPIEIIPFGFAPTLRLIEGAIAACGLSGSITLRRGGDGHAFVTDSGHWIVDAALQRIADPRSLACRLAEIAGVVEHGLFLGIAHTAILAGPNAVRVVGQS